MRLDIDTLEGGAIGVSCALTLHGGSMRFALASSLEIAASAAAERSSRLPQASPASSPSARR